MAANDTFVKGLSDLYQNDTGGYAVSPPLTQTASSHSISIRTDRGVLIGRIQSWSPQISRPVDTVLEIHANSRGEPAERVPQAQTTNSISVERYELYSTHMGEAFGAPSIRADADLVSLADQMKPFHVREMWQDPFGTIRAYGYMGCWFSALGITIAANDDRIVKARATLEFTRKIRIA